MISRKVQLRVPAGNLKAVEAAIENGADAVYVGFDSASNLRNYSGINLSYDDMVKGADLAHRANKEFYVVINSYPQASELKDSFEAVKYAYEAKADAIIVSDMAVMEFVKSNFPELEMHLSVQVGCTNAEVINFYRDEFGITCAVLPRVLTVNEVAEIAKGTDVDIEVFVMGSLCTAYSGRCNASQYITGESTNSRGVCTSPKFLEFTPEENLLFVKLNNITLNEFDFEKVNASPSLSKCVSRCGSDVVSESGPDGWPNSFIVNKRHVCKGQFVNQKTGKKDYILHTNVILDTLPILPQLIEAGVTALKVEGRQRPSAYSANTARILREAIDLYCSNPKAYKVEENWIKDIDGMFEEMKHSVGAYMGR
jgi:putative protease